MFIHNYNYNRPKQLFGTINAKTIKGEELGYKTLIVYMSPERNNTLGKNICSSATEGCANSCLFTSGRGRMSNVIIGRLNKTEYFLRDRNNFMLQLADELGRNVKKYNEYNVCVRLNGTSDIPYENIPVGEYKNIMEMYPNVQFYDYTKVYSRLEKELPSNYHLTFSRAETLKNKIETEKALNLGFNVSAVFAVKDSNELPNEYKGFKVVDGDLHDLTFLHKQPKGSSAVILGLKAKGVAKNDTTGFVIRDF